MMTKSDTQKEQQGDLLKPLLRDIVSPRHGMVKLADVIDRQSFEDGLSANFCADNGRPSCPVRLMVALHYLKYASGMNDEAVLDEWLENPCCQYFTERIFFEYECPTDQSTMSRWRKKLARSGAEKMLEESLKTGPRKEVIKKSELPRVNVDSTVQKKAVRYLTDVRLYDQLRKRLVKSARKNGIELRQTYERIKKRCLHSPSFYAKANQFKRASKATKQLKTFWGQNLRDIKREMTAHDMELQKLLELGERLFNQKKNDKKKLYSTHESQVECIGKGKAHKKFEFGTKVVLVTSAKANWIAGAEAYPGNPYDGHTLKSALQQASKILGFEPEMAICDLGYRGHNYEGWYDVQIVNRFRKRVSRSLLCWRNRRSAIEPVIGHCKSEHRMDRNQLRSSLGDELNVIFAAAGFNIRKLIRAFALFLCRFFKLALIQLVYQLNECCSNRFGKGRSREGKNLSSKGFSFSHPAFA